MWDVFVVFGVVVFFGVLMFVADEEGEPTPASEQEQKVEIQTIITNPVYLIREINMAIDKIVSVELVVLE